MLRPGCDMREVRPGYSFELTGEVSKNRILSIYTRNEIKDILLGKKAELYAHFGAIRGHIACTENLRPWLRGSLRIQPT